MRNYNKLKIWELSHEFTKKIYRLTSGFPKEELYGLTSQLRRCSSSIPTNIAEGAGRESDKEFINFLNIALGSASESEYLLFLSYELKYIEKNEYELFRNDIEQIRRTLFNFKKSASHNSTKS